MTLNLSGALLKIAYRLRHHELSGWSLSRWIGFVLLVGGLVAGILAWPYRWLAIPVGVLFLIHAVFMTWSARKGYAVFRIDAELEGRLRLPSPTSPLAPEEKVPLRACGRFGVHGKAKVFANIEASIQTTALGDLIIMGRISPSRFLLLGRWPEDDVGWWYVFFRPEMIQECQIGRLYFGLHPQMAVRLVYAEREKPAETLMLVFDDEGTLARVKAALVGEGTAGATGSSRET
jgi:hypothetical protein